MVGFRSGQTGQTVNLLATPSKVRILIPPPLTKTACFLMNTRFFLVYGAFGVVLVIHYHPQFSILQTTP